MSASISGASSASGATPIPLSRSMRANADAPAAGAPAESADQKVVRAGRQFEAVLLNNVLGDLERTFTNLPGKKAEGSSEAYSGFAMQALASGLADAGGIGIGRMVSGALARQSRAADSKAANPGKSF